MSRAEQLREVFAECGIGAALEVVGERWGRTILRCNLSERPGQP